MLRLKRLYLRNFMSLGEVDIDFSERGIIGITGFNNKGGASNGAGKTAIIAGLVWTLFGRTPSGNRTKDVLQWGKGTLTGIVEFEQEDKIYRIVRTADTLDFLINGEQVKGLRKDIQDVINQALQTNYELFRTFNVFMKDWQWFITEVGDADKKKLFKSILNLKKLDLALDRSKTILQSLKTTANSLEGEIKQLEQTIPELERNYNKALQAEHEEENKRKASIKQLQEEKKQKQQNLSSSGEVDYTPQIKAIEEEINSYNVDIINKRIEEVSSEVSVINNNIFHHEQNLNVLKEQLDRFNSIGVACPTCGQKMTPQIRVSHRKYLEVLIKEYKETIEEMSSKKGEYISELHKLNEQLKAVEELRKEKERLQYEARMQAENQQQIKSYIDIIDKAIAELQNPITNIKQLVVSAKETLDHAKATLVARTDAFVATIKEIDIYSYLVWLYSRQGVITKIIQLCFDRLKYLANKYLIHICSEGFKIEISPFKQLKSGDFQEEIDIYILDHDRRIPYTSLSSGQQQRVNTALLFALFTWGREIGVNQFDLMLLDEVLDLSLDNKGQEDTINFIRSLRPLIYHIILISHKETTADIFDRQIRVVRDNTGVSTVSKN